MRFLLITALTLAMLLGLTATASATHNGGTGIDVVDCRSDGICTVVDTRDADGTLVAEADLCAAAGLGATIETWRGVSFHNGYRQRANYARCYAS